MQIEITEWDDSLIGQVANLLSRVFGIKYMALSEYNLLIAYCGKKVYGAVVYLEYEDGIDVDYIVVDKDYRGKGIGTRLLRELIQKNKPIVLTPSNDSDVIKFYKKNGFVFDGDDMVLDNT